MAKKKNSEPKMSESVLVFASLGSPTDGVYKNFHFYNIESKFVLMFRSYIGFIIFASEEFVTLFTELRGKLEVVYLFGPKCWD